MANIIWIIPHGSFASDPSAQSTCATTPRGHDSSSSRTSSSASSPTASLTASSWPPTSTASPLPPLYEAAAADDGKHATAATLLKAFSANPRGDAEQRLVAIMASALSSRIGGPPSPSPQQHLTKLCGGEHRAAWQLLHDVFPCFRLALHAANLAILDAVAGHRAVHVIDAGDCPSSRQRDGADLRDESTVRMEEGEGCESPSAAPSRRAWSSQMAASGGSSVPKRRRLSWICDGDGVECLFSKPLPFLQRGTSSLARNNIDERCLLHHLLPVLPASTILVKEAGRHSVL